jgi:hypothetical protein
MIEVLRKKKRKMSSTISDSRGREDLGRGRGEGEGEGEGMGRGEGEGDAFKHNFSPKNSAHSPSQYLAGGESGPNGKVSLLQES